MGNFSSIKGYVSVLEGKPRVELKTRDKKFLIEILESPKSAYSMTKIVNQKFELKLPKDDYYGNSSSKSNSNRSNSNTSQRIDAAQTVFVIPNKGLSDTATLNRMRKLAGYGLIEIPLDKENSTLDKKSFTRKEYFAANLHRGKPFKITEYGLFCMLSKIEEYDPLRFFLRYWRYKVMRVLLASYFEKKTLLRLRSELYFTIAQFLIGACNITIKRLSQIEDATRRNDKKERLELIRRLQDDLLWHAKSFALRLLVDSASPEDDDYHRSRRRVLSTLAYDKKFYKLADIAIREILSYYKGGRLLR